MPYPLTPTIGLPLVPDGDQAWGQAMRDALTALDGIASIERQVAATTPTLGFYETTTLEVNLSQAADLTVLTTDHPAWVRIYGSAAARTEDASRNINTKVTDGRGCFGDAITYLPDGLTLTWSEVPTFQNLDTPRTGKAYLAVTSLDHAYSGPINLTFTYRERGPRTGALQGLAGLDGHTILTMARDPVATDGKDGDIAINTVTWEVFAPKAAGTWPAGVSLVGPQGAPGTNGTNGTNGLDGKTVRYGAADPTATDGVDGDFWINTTTHFIFGPKASGAWPAGTSLVGPAGSGGGGGLVLLEQHTASNSASLDFTSLSSSYDTYLFEMLNIVPAVDNATLIARLSTNGGSTWDANSANYMGGSQYVRMDAAGAGDNSGETSYAGAYLTLAYGTAQPGITAQVTLFNSSAAVWRQFLYQTSGIGSGNSGYYTQQGGAIWKNTSQANAIQFLLSSGNIASGTIRVYGIAK
jgi:hypothetical protein